jgi:hypothetical protein
MNLNIAVQDSPNVLGRAKIGGLLNGFVEFQDGDCLVA